MSENKFAGVNLDNAFVNSLPKPTESNACYNSTVDAEELYQLYKENPLLSIVAQFYPEMMVKGDFVEIKLGEEESYGDEFISWAEDEEFIDELFQTLVYTNIFGTHLCIIDVDDGTDPSRLSKPINYSAITKLNKLTPVRFDLAEVVVRDTKKDFEKGIDGTYYKIGDIEWHQERIIRFDNTAVVMDAEECSQSKIQSVLEAYNFYKNTHNVVGKIADSASIPILGIEGLIMKLGGDEDSVRIITERLRLASESIKRMGAIGIDSTTESLEFVERNLSGLDNIVQIAKDFFASVAQIPDSMLFQRKSSGGGLSDSGLMERSTVAAITTNLQTRMLKSPMRRLIRIFAAIEGISGRLKITFPSTLELSKEEEAKLKKLMAEASKLDAESEKIRCVVELLKQLPDAGERLADSLLPGGTVFEVETGEVESPPSEEGDVELNNPPRR